jgi:hypothetical protein
MLKTIGTDPEFFILNNSTKEIVSSDLYITGNKDEVQILNSFVSIHKDNIMIEANILPSVDKESFIRNINKTKQSINAYLNSLYNLSIIEDVVSPDVTHLIDDYQFYEFGCSPDFNVYNNTPLRKLKPNRTMVLPDTHRFAGGHIHIGITNPTRLRVFNLVKYCDMYIGSLLPILDKDNLRKKYYGIAGNFRPKRYGMEYRTPSNFWLQNDTLIGIIWDQCEKAVHALENHFPIDESIKNIINKDSKAEALNFIEKHNIFDISKLQNTNEKVENIRISQIF